jgi:hypothetical protein
MPSGSPRGSIGTNTIGNVSTLSGGTQSGGAWGYTDGRSGGESQINNGPITITGGSRGDLVSAAVARNMASTARAASANAAIGVNNSTTADRNTAYTGGSGGALGTIGSGGGRPVTNFASSASGPLVPGRSPDPGVIGVAGGVSGRMAPAFANRFNFVGGAKARGGSNPLGGLTTPAVGQLIGFADHLRSQGMMDPLNVTSAYRSQAVQDSLRKANPKSAALGRIAKNSAHTKGTAIDITHPGMSNAQLAAQVASYPGFNTMMGYESARNPQGSHIHVEAGEGPLRGLGSVGGKKVASIVSGAPRPSAPIQTASLGPIAMSAPRIGIPPIPQRNPMRTNIPVPQSKPIGPQIASLGVPTPQMAPGGFFSDEINAAMNARPTPPSAASMFTAERPKTYDERAIPYGDDRDYPTSNLAAKSDQSVAADYTSMPKRTTSLAGAAAQGTVSVEGAQAFARKIWGGEAPKLTPPRAPQMHPDRSQELASRPLPSQPLLNTRSATAIEGWQPQNFTPPQMPSRPMVGVESLPPSLRKKDQEQVPMQTTGLSRGIDVADLAAMGVNTTDMLPNIQEAPEFQDEAPSAGQLNWNSWVPGDPRLNTPAPRNQFVTPTDDIALPPSRDWGTTIPGDPRLNMAKTRNVFNERAAQYSGPGVGASPPLSTPTTSANAATGLERYTDPNAPAFDPSVYDYNKSKMSDPSRRKYTPAPPKAHEIQQPGQVPGRPSVVTGLDPKYDPNNPYGPLPKPNAPARFDKEGDDAAGKWRKAETYIKTANSGRRDMFGNRNERPQLQISRLARVLVERGEADSQREARELAENILDYSRITYS